MLRHVCYCLFVKKGTTKQGSSVEKRRVTTIYIQLTKEGNLCQVR